MEPPRVRYGGIALATRGNRIDLDEPQDTLTTKRPPAQSISGDLFGTICSWLGLTGERGTSGGASVVIGTVPFHPG
jgi:hypothetical protein